VDPVNVAVTLRADVMETVQVEVPLHAPDQPENVEPVAAVAVRVTLVPDAKEAEQVAPQLIPAGLDVTVPDPVPAFVTVSVYVGLVNVAVTLADWVMRT
jgi:hypothetical protein